MYNLLQHLELSHPENGESPFIARERTRSKSRSISRGRLVGTKEGSRHSRSRSNTLSQYIESDDESADQNYYVECPAKCGEAVILSELADHMDQHDIEGLAVDERSPSGSLDISRNASPHSRASSIEPRAAFCTPVAAHFLKRTTLSAQRKPADYFGLKEFKNLLLGPASKKTRTTGAKSVSKSARRLGVS
jgi:hypothetical protein